MSRLKSPRFAVAVALAAVWFAGAVLAQRSSSSRTASAMTTAATRFLEGLTPEQRLQATLPLDAEDRLRTLEYRTTPATPSRAPSSNA